MTWFRASVLTFTLAIVVGTMVQLKNKGLPSGVDMLLGLESAGPSKLTWCDTRVKSLELAQGVLVEQMDAKWVRRPVAGEDGTQAGASTVELDGLAVEKWFGEFCTVAVTPNPSATTTNWTSALVVTFIKGSQSTLLTDEAGLFRWKDTTFHSPSLNEAIAALASLPHAKPQP